MKTYLWQTLVEGTSQDELFYPVIEVMSRPDSAANIRLSAARMVDTNGDSLLAQTEIDQLQDALQQAVSKKWDTVYASFNSVDFQRMLAQRYLEVLHKALNEAKIGRFVVAVPCSKRLGLLSQDRHGSFFIGGAEDKTKISTSTTQANQLKKSDLAQTVIVYLLKRTDTNRAAYDVLMKPRRLKSITAASNLEELGQVWEACTKANCGMPPLSSAHDNATTQLVFSVLFLGMLPTHTYADKTFWKECSTIKFPVAFPEYCFATLCYQGHPLFDHNDACHTQKNIVEAARKRTRTV
ncbi:unnamed protein product [Symbiodinium microadriaticum]|nr:unnamed protein product [Symbiodinium sp. KB8]CAE7797727.1 unnamed protein product [Symbiodinium microadriaticum]